MKVRFFPVRRILHALVHVLRMAPPCDDFGGGGSSSFLEVGLFQQRSALKACVYRSFQGYAELS